MYGKLEDGVLKRAPKMMDIGDNHVYNPTAEQYEAAGYKVVNYTEPPEAPEGFHYEPSWEEAEDSINQVWTLVEDPDEVSPEEALDFLFGDGGES